MAEKKIVRSGVENFDVLMDESDPLAELARIVGHDARPDVLKLQDLQRHQESARREAVFNLEDELSRAFALYDAPPSDIPSVDHHPSEVPAAPQPAAHMRREPFLDSLFAETPASEPVSEPQFSDPEYPEPELAGPDFGQSEASPPVDNPAIEAGIDAPVFAGTFEPAQETEMSPLPAVAEEAPEPAIDATTMPSVDISHPQPFPSAISDDDDALLEVHPFDEGDATPASIESDLEYELGLSIGYDEPLVQVRSDAGASSDWLGPVMASAHAPDQPVALSTPEATDAEVDYAPSMPSALGPVQPMMSSPAVETTDNEGSPPIVTPAEVTGPVDSLLADIARFPLPQPLAPQQVSGSVRKSTYPFTPNFSRATPVASGGQGQSQKAFVTPIVAPVAAFAPPPVAAITEPAPQLPEQDQEFHDMSAQDMPGVEVPDLEMPEVAEAVAVDRFDDDRQREEAAGIADIELDDFEIDLSDIELDLDPAELDASTEEALSIAADEDEIAHEDAVPAFDPALFSDAEELPTQIVDLHVPQLAVAEQERPMPRQTDFDLDIDAEMAQLFTQQGASPGTSSAPSARIAAADVHPAAVIAFPPVAAPTSASGTPETEMDAFERAMEEDFRRTFSERREAASAAAPMTQETDPETFADAQPPRRARWPLMAACILAVLFAGTAGGYAWFGWDGTGLSGGDPVVILADKEPVKVVPVEKGGKVVPNQDKAVYDRVAGAPEEQPVQDVLVSSAEEPVDVVQRTLTPETLPLEDGEDAGVTGTATPVDPEDTARLLPDEAPADSADKQDNVPAVAPRKVRTMIVKPDGTLVAREDPAPVVAETIAAETVPQEPLDSPVIDGTPELAAPTEPGPVVSQMPELPEPVVEDAGPAVPTPGTEAASGTPLRTDDPSLFVDAPEDAMAAAANAVVDETAPVRVVRTTPVEQPTPNTSGTPVPQARPVDQPVNVVGTVTDEGNVRTAAAEPTATPAPAALPAETPVAAPAPLPAGSYVIQIASLPSEAEAQRSYQSLSSRFTGVIGGRGVDIRRADIEGKGTYYRVRIPAGSREEANSLCARYKSAGGSCLVTR